MKIPNHIVVILIFLFCLSSCTPDIFKPRSIDEIKNLGETDRIGIRVNRQNAEGEWVEDFTKTIDDTKQIEAISRTLEKYSDGWESYVPYLPGRLTVEFYDNEELIVPIIVVSFANTGGSLSYFLSRPAGPARPIEESEFKELMGLLGLEEDLAYYADLTISVK
jgi:hypothetical protein